MREPEIIPQPVSIQHHNGVFELTPSTRILTCKEHQHIGKYLSQLLERATGFGLDVGDIEEGTRQNTCIVLLTAAEKGDLGDEGYELSVESEQIVIHASDPMGAFYACQTLRQLLPVEIEEDDIARNVVWTVPHVKIEDIPRFSWRGFFLDSCRHYQNKELVMDLMDKLALYKINRFHWHLFDNEGWRMEMRKYPELTSRPTNGLRGEYYTQEDIREIIEYARARYIGVYPEVEMPGHSLYALDVFKDMRCENAVAPVREFCLGSAKTDRFIKDVLSEVMEAFPEAIIHLGGDEAEDTHWKQCSRCQVRIRKNGLENERMLQKWFMDTMTSYVHERGHGTMAWADHLGLGWPAGQIVQGWNKGESEYAIAHGMNTVNSNCEYVYFDYPNDQNDPMRFDWMPLLPTTKVYSFDPIPADATLAQSALVMGSEACLWTENVTESTLYEKIFPRLFAFSEVVWSPKESRDWNNFERRMETHLRRLDAMGVSYWA